MLIQLGDFRPELAENVFVAANASVIGKVKIGKNSSVWYNAVLRGDMEEIIIGERTNIQDGAIVHTTTLRTPTVIGNDVTVGHNAIIHGCTIENEVLIGMGAIILDEVHVPKHTIVAANALVTERSVLESGWLYAGIPAKKIKELSPAQIKHLKMSAEHYVLNAEIHQKHSIVIEN
jgi:carbonic anhydrase/acetyltransferase-like protein (isoleucine patch superfamily)